MNPIDKFPGQSSRRAKVSSENMHPNLSVAKSVCPNMQTISTIPGIINFAVYLELYICLIAVKIVLHVLFSLHVCFVVSARHPGG